MVRALNLEDELEQERISKYERDIIEPPLHVLKRYAEIANVWVDVLIDDDLDLPETIPCKVKSEGIERKRKYDAS